MPELPCRTINNGTNFLIIDNLTKHRDRQTDQPKLLASDRKTASNRNTAQTDQQNNAPWFAASSFSTDQVD